MREDHVDRRVVEVVVMGCMICWRVAQKLLETTSADCDIDAEDAVPVEVGLGIPAHVVMDDQRGEGVAGSRRCSRRGRRRRTRHPKRRLVRRFPRLR